MRRALVIGIPGAGKSTFARALADRTGLPLIHLDKEFWQPGWTETPPAVWRTKVMGLAAGDAWIMDGNYAGTLEVRLARADAVFWFDYPTRVCLWRALRRAASTYGRVREDMAAGCPERFDAEFLRYIWTFNARERPKTTAALDRAGQRIVPVVFRRDGEVTQFLNALA